ncbi:MAG: isocitrate/isopropylmalate family dehydrogenase, partial [Zetaproteobacteria bacterium]|nr:isocitrate/isopropylmalate family dehydrogenase [Zetaproteobacteria bacterium]
MLRYSFGLNEEADAIDKAVEQVLNEGVLTADLVSGGGKSVGTEEMGDAIVARI